MFRVLHLSMLRLIAQVWLQLESWVKSYWREILSDGFKIILYNSESSAKIAILDSCWMQNIIDIAEKE